MKKLLTIFIILTVFLGSTTKVEANMAAPDDADIASTITFEKNESLSVLNEILNIEVKGSIANISALYHMKNKTQEEVTTSSMFLSPNIEGDTTRVYIDNYEITYTAKTYKISYRDDVIETNDWEFVILEEENDDYYRQQVDTITFEMTFLPLEEHDIEVSYKYTLGGYPNYDFDVKYGSIYYYLKPAGLWESFESIEINLTLDEDMPKITSSSLEFTKLSKNKYQYKANELPDTDLLIRIDQSAWDEFISGFKSPYLIMKIMMLLPVIIIFLCIIIIIIMATARMRKNKIKNIN